MAVTFFIVEDHALMSTGIRQFLEKDGEFACAGGAETLIGAECALRVLSEQDALPDIVLLDLFLGEESSLPLLRASFGGKSLKFLVYSMFSSPGIVDRALSLGASGFVSKSAPTAELVTALKAVAAGGSYIQQSLGVGLYTWRDATASLTKKEKSVLNLLLERKTVEEISASLGLNRRTVENYQSRIYSKTGISGREELLSQFG